jgi:hypothetical protein
MLDLLRALRNKRNHYNDMPDHLKDNIGGKIPPEAIIASQVQLNNDRMAAHQQARESVCPEICVREISRNYI